jgi:eukaryotic-like serine/threonine-protein kinase
MEGMTPRTGNEELESLSRELGQDLELIRPLGEGSTARVYLAREPALQRLVAVKFLRDVVASDPVVRQRFEREAQSAARISHPHVTQIYRIGRLASAVPYIVMEYIDGRPLDDVIEARGALGLDEAREALACVASALAAAHQQGIVHRDVRPGNVFLENRTGRAVLGDFGIAALLETGSATSARLTAVGARIGDVRYMSPEQIVGEPVTEQSDMYAFGILAYEVLTREGPFDAASDAQLLAAHVQGRPHALRERRPDIDPHVASLIERCLSRDPNRRPRAQEVVRVLQQPPSGPAVPAPAPGAGADVGPVAAFLNELRRRRVYQVLVAYGAAAAAVLGGSQAVYEAFDLPSLFYRIVVATVLGGFPVALALSWIYDVTAGGIHRTRPGQESGSRRVRLLTWIGLGLSVAVVLIIGWLLL